MGTKKNCCHRTIHLPASMSFFGAIYFFFCWSEICARSRNYGARLPNTMQRIVILNAYESSLKAFFSCMFIGLRLKFYIWECLPVYLAENEPGHQVNVIRWNIYNVVTIIRQHYDSRRLKRKGDPIQTKSTKQAVQTRPLTVSNHFPLVEPVFPYKFCVTVHNTRYLYFSLMKRLQSLQYLFAFPEIYFSGRVNCFTNSTVHTSLESIYCWPSTIT